MRRLPGAGAPAPYQYKIIMKIKLTDNVVHSGEAGAGRHLKKGTVHDLDDKLAASLVKRGLATTDLAEPKAPETPAPAAPAKPATPEPPVKKK